jgi:hypothetical protein
LSEDGANYEEPPENQPNYGSGLIQNPSFKTVEKITSATNGSIAKWIHVRNPKLLEQKAPESAESLTV